MRRYTLPFVVLLYALGIWLGRAVPGHAPALLVWTLCLLIGLVGALALTRSRPFVGGLRAGCLSILACGCVLAGTVRMGAHQARALRLQSLLPVGETLEVEGWLERKSAHWKLHLEGDLGGTLLVSRFDARGWRDGQRVWLRGLRRPPGVPAWPGDFSGSRAGLGWLRPIAWRLLAQPHELSAAQLRARLLRLWHAGMRPRTRALLGSILLGERDLLSRQQLAHFKAAGIYHLLVVSGLHVYALVGLVTWLPRRLGAKPCAWLLGLSTAIAFGLLVGGQVSVTRAALTCCCGLSLRRGGWQPDALALLSLVAWLILLVAPSELFAPGFQLSFAAVCSLVLGRARSGRWWWRSLWASSRVTLATAPLLAYHFGAVSLIAVLANLVAIPCATLLLALAAVSLPLAALWGQVPEPLLAVLEALASGLSLLAAQLAGIPWARVAVAGLSWWSCLGLLLASLFVLCRPRRVLRWLLLLSVLQVVAPRSAPGVCVTTVRARGLTSVLVQTPGWQAVRGERGGSLDRFLLAHGLLAREVGELPDGVWRTPAGPLLVAPGSLHLPGFACAWPIPRGVFRWSWQDGKWRLQTWGLPPPSSGN